MPITFGSLTGRGLGNSSDSSGTPEVLIQPATTKMILVGGGGSAGPGARGSGYPPHPWYSLWENDYSNTSIALFRGEFWEDICNGYDNSTNQPTWTTASNGYESVYSGSFGGGMGSGGGGSGEVKYSNVANVFHGVTYAVTIGTGGVYTDTGPDGRGPSGTNSTLTAPAPGVPGGLTVTATGGGGGGGGGANPIFRFYGSYPSTAGISFHTSGNNGGSGGGAGGGMFDFANSTSEIGYAFGVLERVGGNRQNATVNQTSTGQFIGAGGVGGTGFNQPPSLMAGGGGGASGIGGSTTDATDTKFGSGRSMYTPIELGANQELQLANTAYRANVFYNLGLHGNGLGAQHFTGNHPVTKTFGAYNVVSADGCHGTGLFHQTSAVPVNFRKSVSYLYAGCNPGSGGDGFDINFCFNYYSGVTPSYGSPVNFTNPPGIVSGPSTGITTDHDVRLMPSMSPSIGGYPHSGSPSHGALDRVIAGGGGGCAEKVSASLKNKLGGVAGTTAVLHYPSTPGTTFTFGTSSSSDGRNGLGARTGSVAAGTKPPGAGGQHDRGDAIPDGSGGDGVFIMQHSDANAIATCTGNPTIFKTGGNVYYIFKSTGTFNWANTIPE